MAEATGELIAFLDADDVRAPEKAEIQVAISRPTGLGMLGMRTYGWPAKTHSEIEYTGQFSPRMAPFQDLVVRNAFTTSSVVVRKDVLLEIGEFDVDQNGTEDYDLWLRMAERIAVANLPIPLTGYRVAIPGSLSKNAMRMESGMRLILQKLERLEYFEVSICFIEKPGGTSGTRAGTCITKLGATRSLPGMSCAPSSVIRCRTAEGRSVIPSRPSPTVGSDTPQTPAFAG